MVEQHKKRGSQLDNGENAESSSNKKPRTPTSVIKHKQLDEGRRGEEAPEEGGKLAKASLAALWRPRKSSLMCKDGHVVCGTCRVSHGQACGSAATHAACAEVDAFVRDAKLPCKFQGHGCGSYAVYCQAGDHERACPWAPCCCQFLTSPPRLVEHTRTAHPAWPISSVSYGKLHKIPMPRPAAEEGQCVFLVTSSAAGPATTTLVSVVCARANGDAAAGVAQFKCTLWADAPRGSEIAATLTFPVESSDLSGGFSPEEQSAFLAVTPKMMAHVDASGEAAGLVVRIDRVGRVAASSSPAPRSSGELLRQAN
nr:unnamed protein product [Digitaria exilis]